MSSWRHNDVTVDVTVVTITLVDEMTNFVVYIWAWNNFYTVFFKISYNDKKYLVAGLHPTWNPKIIQNQPKLAKKG